MFLRLTLFVLSFFDFFHKKKIVDFFKRKKIVHFETFFDVGAHHGESINFYSKNFKIEKIYSFEPSQDNFDILKKKINKKQFKNKKIFIENFALGEKSKNEILRQTNETSSSSINEINKNSKYYKKKRFFLQLDYEKKLNIRQIKLRDYIKENKIVKMDLMKIDTEGYEYFVMLGADEFLKDFKYIIFEHHYDDMIEKKYKFSQISKLLKENNFIQMLKLKMPFRKTFEYIYFNKKIL
jgi:FkbM family methyltransferase